MWMRRACGPPRRAMGMPIGDGALAGTQGGHREQIDRGGMPVNAGVWHHDLVDQDLGLWAEYLLEPLKDDDGFVVGPVVQDVSQVVEARALHWLLLEEVMRHYLDALERGYVGKSLREVLEDKLVPQLRESSLKGDALMAKPRADIDQCGRSAKEPSVLLKRERGKPLDGPLRLNGHGLLKGLEALRLGGQPHEHGELCWVRLLSCGLCSIIDVTILGLGEKVRESLQHRPDVVKMMVSDTTISRLGQSLGELVGSEGILISLLDLADRCKISQNAA